jgi:hypothetical protein
MEQTRRSQDNRKISYMKALKDFQDTSYVKSGKEFQDKQPPKS